jgi:hypothetical protein
MLNIRRAILNDVPLLHSLIQEMADYERLSLLISEQTLASNGFGTQPMFRALIADFDWRVRWLRLFFRLVLDIPRSRLVLGRPVRSTPVPQEQDRLGAVVAYRGNRRRGKVFWSYAARLGLERDCDPVL